MNKIKRTIGLIAVLAALSIPASAQVFYLDEDEESQNLRNDKGGGGEAFGMGIIGHGEVTDASNYVPVGSGALLLAALGGAYLLGKKKEK